MVSLSLVECFDVSLCPILQELLVRLTDESDPFFLYSLALGEDDFQGWEV